MEKMYFNPGCALSLYKPDLERKAYECIKACFPDIEMHRICCHYNPGIEANAVIVNVCAGCNRRFNSLYEGVRGITLWEIIDGMDSFSFPDYKDIQVSVHDPCPVRNQPEVHQAVRSLLKKMNLNIVETPQHGTKSVCCGDSFYPELAVERVHEQMRLRSQSMPCDNVVVYCVSCIKSIHIGGKQPRHLLDLLFSEATIAEPADTEEWHRQIGVYRQSVCPV